MEITLTLPDETFRQAETLARRSRRDVGEILAETIRRSLSMAGEAAAELPAIAELPDEALKELAQSRMDPEHDERLSRLLERNREGALTTPERYEMDDLLRIYREGLLRKARAVREAVQRGLIDPPAG